MAQVFWLIFASMIYITSSRYTKEELQDNVDWLKSDVSSHGILPAFMRSTTASVCHTLVGNLCPRVPEHPYDESDSSDNPVMGNTKKYDIKMKRVPGASHAEAVVEIPHHKSWPAPGEKPYHYSTESSRTGK
jgi:hypothetical protein